MKKFFYGIAALAMGFSAASCQPEGLESASSETVIYEIQLPAAVQTKGETGYATYDLYYEVYKTSDVEALDATQFLFDEKIEISGNTATVKLELLNNHAYTVLFWANQAGTNYYKIADDNKSDLLALEMNLDGIKSNNDDRDAFCAVATLAKTTQSQKKTVRLRRPFSQVNIGTILATDKFDITPLTSIVTIKGVPTTFNVATGLSGNTFTDIAFAEANVPTGTTTIKGVGYTNVAMNYIYVPEGTVDVEYTITTLHGNVSNEVPNVPVEKNHRTYIIGNLLTSNATYNIVIVPEFEGEITYEYVAEGVSKGEDGEYYVSTAKGLSNMAKVSAGPDAVFNLTEDVDLSNYDWNPIGSSSAPFEGVFDGNNHKIVGLTVSDPDVASFIAFTAENTVIKNVTLENVTLESDYAAAGLIYWPSEGTQIENVKVSGTINGKKSYGAGLVFYGDGVAIKNCENNAAVTASMAAGLVSWITNSTLENVVNNGVVTGTNSAGGIANRFSGSIKNAVNNGTVVSTGGMPAAGVVAVQANITTYEYCYNYAAVTSSFDDVNASASGIVGHSSTASTLNYCANYGAITAENSYASGIAYNLYGGVKANYCYNSGAVTGADGAGAISADAAYGSGETASYCLNAGTVTSSNGVAYQASEKNVSSYYYDGSVLKSVSDNAEVAAEDALAVLNGGTDNAFFSTENDIITVK